MTNKELFVETRLYPFHGGSTEPAGTVIDSLQLLRTSLENVAVYELGETLEHLADLKTRLGSLQMTLTTVAALKHCESRVQSAREEIEADLTRMHEAPLTNPWLFTGFLKLDPETECESAESIRETPEVEIASLVETGPEMPSYPRELGDPEGAEQIDLQSREAAKDGYESPGHEVENREQPSVIDLDFQIQSDTPPFDNGVPSESGQDLSSAPDLGSSSAESRDEPAEEIPAESTEGAEQFIDETVRTPEQQTDAGNRPEFPGRRNDASDAPAFDTKLLDDLIRNYGEFVASSPAKPAAQEFEGFEPSEPHREPESTAAAVPVPHPAAAHSSQHELDRELKKIIRDYGQVDLYSDGHRITKRRAIVAFAVLGVVLSSIYFFSGPTETGSNPPALHQTKSTADPAESGSGVQLSDGPGHAATIAKPGEQPARAGSGSSQARQRLKK